MSAQDAICELVTKIYRSIDDNRCVAGVFVDQTKAFDTVSHTLLVGCLEDIGFRGVALDLCKSYLGQTAKGEAW